MSSRQCQHVLCKLSCMLLTWISHTNHGLLL